MQWEENIKEIWNNWNQSNMCHTVGNDNSSNLYRICWLDFNRIEISHFMNNDYNFPLCSTFDREKWGRKIEPEENHVTKYVIYVVYISVSIRSIDFPLLISIQAVSARVQIKMKDEIEFNDIHFNWSSRERKQMTNYSIDMAKAWWTVNRFQFLLLFF